MAATGLFLSLNKFSRVGITSVKESIFLGMAYTISLRHNMHTLPEKMPIELEYKDKLEVMVMEMNTGESEEQNDREMRLETTCGEDKHCID